jgi:hypothetical protein
MYKAIYNSDGESIEAQFTPIINTAKKYFLFDIMLRFDEIQRAGLKDLRKSNDIDITIENELEQNMFNLIADPKNRSFNFKKFYFRGANIEDKLFEEIDKFLRLLDFDKICIYVHTTKSGLEMESGKRLRDYLPFSKEDSPIIYSYNQQFKDKAVAYVHLIGIQSEKEN